MRGMTKAIDLFNQLEKGVSKIIKAADLYALYTMANIRNEEPPKDAIEAIIKSNNVSGWNMMGELYKVNEMNFLEQEKHFEPIGQQILMATYTVLEIYLIEKFREYYMYMLNDKDKGFVESIYKKLSFRSIDEIKDNYYNILKIHLPSFEIEYFSSEKSNFQPNTSWDAIKLIAKARNDIAHIGKAKSYKIITPMDSWYPFEFVCRWVSFFDTNFNFLVYEKIQTSLVKDYNKRVPICA
jgi:hypothetical protein